MGIDPAKSSLPDPEGELDVCPDCISILIPKQQRLCSEGPISSSHACSCALPTKINGSLQRTIILPSEDTFVASTSRSQGSIVRNQPAKHRILLDRRFTERATYTWRVVDNGQVGGAVLKARAAREENELTCRKLEANVSRELSRIANDLQAIDARESIARNRLCRRGGKRPDRTGECRQRSRLAA